MVVKLNERRDLTAVTRPGREAQESGSDENV